VANALSKDTDGATQMEEYKPLTGKIEQFAQAMASGANQTDAYRVAYSTGNMTVKTVWEKASRLAAHDKVSARVAALKADLADKQLWTRAQSVQALIDALETARASGNPSAMTGAVKELNAMHGYDAPIRHDHASRDRSMTPQVINLSMTPQQAAEAYAAMLDATRLK
jgi:hypothetical protein